MRLDDRDQATRASAAALEATSRSMIRRRKGEEFEREKGKEEVFQEKSDFSNASAAAAAQKKFDVEKAKEKKRSSQSLSSLMPSRISLRSRSLLSRPSALTRQPSPHP